LQSIAYFGMRGHTTMSNLVMALAFFVQVRCQLHNIWPHFWYHFLLKFRPNNQKYAAPPPLPCFTRRQQQTTDNRQWRARYSGTLMFRSISGSFLSCRCVRSVQVARRIMSRNWMGVATSCMATRAPHACAAARADEPRATAASKIELMKSRAQSHLACGCADAFIHLAFRRGKFL